MESCEKSMGCSQSALLFAHSVPCLPGGNNEAPFGYTFMPCEAGGNNERNAGYEPGNERN